MTSPWHEAALAVAGALFNSLWQGPLVAGAVWLALRCAPKLGASTRYAVWLCALVALVAIPCATTRLASAGAPNSDEIVAPAAREITPAAPPSPPRAADALQPAERGETTGPVAFPEPAHERSPFAVPPMIAFSATLLWLATACARAVRLGVNILQLARTRRNARAWAVRYGYPVVVSDRVRVPVAIGFLRPAIVLPPLIVHTLSAADLDAVVVHEAAHLRRGDVWTNALARIVEALSVVNPAAWFVMRRLNVEREIACDDFVVARTGRGEAFARTLLAIAGGTASDRVPAAAVGAAGSHHAIVQRVERLLEASPRRLVPSRPAIASALAMLALFALAAQSASPVLAYAGGSGAPIERIAAAATCGEPDRGIRIMSFRPIPKGALPPGWVGSPMPSAATVVARFGAATVATFDLTVDAAGRARSVSVKSAPNYAGMPQHVRDVAMKAYYLPALRGCRAVTSTIRTALRFGTPRPSAYSIVAPAYPSGWSARFPSSCKVPTVQRGGVPPFPAESTGIGVDAVYNASVRVRVNEDGTAAHAEIVTSSGRRAFDSALLAAARNAAYPLTDRSGFKQVRPSGAPLSWNAAHGLSTYAQCTPRPAEYVWTAEFSMNVPVGIPGSDRSVQ